MKIAVIGAAGRMGSMRARHLIDMGHEVCCYDIASLPADLAVYEGRDDGSGFYDSNPDAIVIATPADRHRTGIAAAVLQGLHVFIEKPLCLIGETQYLRNTLNEASAKNLIVATGYNLRFHPAVMRVKDAIASGEFKPMWGSFMLRQKPARPLAHFLEGWASHEVDLALHLLGTDIRHMFVDFSSVAMLKMALVHGKDKAVVKPDGVMSFIHADALTEPFRRAFTLVDQDGRSITEDIETDHVQEEHYRAELAAWVERIEYRQKHIDYPNGRLATGWDGLAVIELLERLLERLTE